MGREVGVAVAGLEVLEGGRGVVLLDSGKGELERGGIVWQGWRGGDGGEKSDFVECSVELVLEMEFFLFDLAYEVYEFDDLVVCVGELALEAAYTQLGCGVFELEGVVGKERDCSRSEEAVVVCGAV